MQAGLGTHCCIDCGRLKVSLRAKRCHPCGIRKGWENPERRNRMMGDNNPAKRPEVRAKNKAFHNTPEYLASISGENSPAKRPEAIAKMIVARNTSEYVEKYTGPNHPCWRGGYNRYAYSRCWPKISKQAIAAAGGICCWPGCTLVAVQTHHINGNSADDGPINLLPLCISHHSHITARPEEAEQHEIECLFIQEMRFKSVIQL